MPLAVWGVAAGTVFVTAELAGRSPFRVSTWSFEDPLLYMDIARHGYTLFRCPPGAWTGSWCGNAGWFPAYPWLVRWVGGVGPGVAWAALALSWLFTLGTLVLLWATFLGRRVRAEAASVLVFAAFAPAGIYDYALYPLSMLAFFTVAYLWFVRQERWLAAGLTGMVVVLAYPLGIGAPAAAGLYLLIAYRGISLWERVRLMAWAVGPAALSLGLFFLDLQLTVGHWNAYFLVQGKYHHHFIEPFSALVHAIGTLFASGSFTLTRVAAIETLLVTTVLACVLSMVVRRGPQASRTDVLLALWAGVTWLIPATTSNLSGHRGEAALFPIAILVGRLPHRLALAFVIAAVATSIPIDVLYLRNELG